VENIISVLFLGINYARRHEKHLRKPYIPFTVSKTGERWDLLFIQVVISLYNAYEGHESYFVEYNTVYFR